MTPPRALAHRGQVFGPGRALAAALAAAAALASCAAAPGVREPDASGPRALVAAAFARWRDNTGGPFELLADDAEWTITGSSPLARTYRGRQQFLDEVIAPFDARVATPLVPELRDLWADGDTVIATFEGRALARDGKPYRNTYCWCMQFRGDRIVRVTAFLDTRWLDELWTRVPLAAGR